MIHAPAPQRFPRRNCRTRHPVWAGRLYSPARIGPIALVAAGSSRVWVGVAEEGVAVAKGIQIGQLLIEQGVLTAKQVEHILKVQKMSHRPFGDLAERLFGISPQAVEDAWVQQYLRIAPTVYRPSPLKESSVSSSLGSEPPNRSTASRAIHCSRFGRML